MTIPGHNLASAGDSSKPRQGCGRSEYLYFNADDERQTFWKNRAQVWVPVCKENVDTMEYIQDEGNQDTDFIVCLAQPNRWERKEWPLWIVRGRLIALFQSPKWCREEEREDMLS